MSLNNKVAVVTGASSGIGAAIAVKLSEEGAKVVMVGRNQIKLDNVEKQVEEKGSKPLVINADITIEDEAKRIINNTVEHFGRIDILVNNAGVERRTLITDENILDHYELVMNTNFKSAIFLMHLAAPHLKETKGNIINISSIASKALLDEIHLLYCASKAALDIATRSVARQLGTDGVRANTINPGPVRTDIMENSGMSKEDLAKRAENMQVILDKTTVLGRRSEPEEVADLAVFLASDKAKAITGSSFFTDNGFMLKLA